MSVGAFRNVEQIKKLNRRSQDVPGAVVVGGDYQGLGHCAQSGTARYSDLHP